MSTDRSPSFTDVNAKNEVQYQVFILIRELICSYIGQRIEAFSGRSTQLYPLRSQQVSSLSPLVSSDCVGERGRGRWACQKDPISVAKFALGILGNCKRLPNLRLGYENWWQHGWLVENLPAGVNSANKASIFSIAKRNALPDDGAKIILFPIPNTFLLSSILRSIHQSEAEGPKSKNTWHLSPPLPQKPTN